MPSTEFWWLLLAAAAFQGILFLVERAVGRGSLRASVMRSEDAYKRMEGIVDTLKGTIQDKDKMLLDMHLAAKEQGDRITSMGERIRDLERELATEKKESQELKRQLQDKKLIPPTPEKLSIVAIWPDGDKLDPEANKKALEQSGLTHRALLGTQASMAEVMWTLPRVKPPPNAITVGGKGNTEGILLKDGLATNQWFARLAARFGIQYFLFLSDYSEGSRGVSIADAVFGVPNVRAVVSVNGEILDETAREFERIFYERVQSGSPLSEAFSDAQMAVWAFRDLFVLREKEASGA